MIPAEAVEAAAKAIQDAAVQALSSPSVDGVYDGMPYWEHIAQVALEAAAPYMLRAAKAEAWEEGYDRAESDHYGTGFWTKRLRANPYMLSTEGEK